MMTIKNFEELMAWQKAYILATEVKQLINGMMTYLRKTDFKLSQKYHVTLPKGHRFGTV